MKDRSAPLPALVNFAVYGDCGPLTYYTRKGGKTVFFPIAYPTTPATPLQIYQRERLKLVAEDWKALTQGDRDAWGTMATKPRTWMSGYNLFTMVELNFVAREYLPALQRQAGLPSIPPFSPR
jgi:hypothetical protein